MKLLLRLCYFCLLFAGLAIICPVPADAQHEIFAGLRGKQAPVKSRMEYTYTLYPDSRIQDRDADLSSAGHLFQFYVPIWNNDNDLLSLSAKFEKFDLDSDIVMPDSGEEFPEELFDINVGLGLHHMMKNGKIIIGNLKFGSASDEPFDSGDEIVISAITILSIPHRGNNAWIISLFYNSNRDFLKHWPLPGFGYSYNPSRRFAALVGVPFIFINSSPVDDLTLRFAYVPLIKITASVYYRFIGPLSVYGGFKMDDDAYYLAGREDKEQRLFYQEDKVFTGLRANVDERIMLDVSVSYAFRRLFFESEDYFDRDFNRIEIEDSWAGAAKVMLRF